MEYSQYNTGVHIVNMVSNVCWINGLSWELLIGKYISVLSSGLGKYPAIETECFCCCPSYYYFTQGKIWGTGGWYHRRVRLGSVGGLLNRDLLLLQQLLDKKCKNLGGVPFKSVPTFLTIISH